MVFHENSIFCKLYINFLTLFRSSYAVTKGPFGGIKGRDYLAVLSLDGTLSIFEQETHTFSRFLPGFLVPGNHLDRDENFCDLFEFFAVKSLEL